eukprot:9487624-Pyramimonas_sp.AAC.1
MWYNETGQEDERLSCVERLKANATHQVGHVSERKGARGVGACRVVGTQKGFAFVECLESASLSSKYQVQSDSVEDDYAENDDPY